MLKMQTKTFAKQNTSAELKIYDRIDEATVSAFENFININEDETYLLRVNSQGGKTECGVRCAAMIEATKNRHYYVGVGEERVFSSALIIHQTCHERFSYSTTKFLVHLWNAGNDKGYAVRLPWSEMRAYEEMQKSIFQYFSMRTGKTLDFIYKLATKGKEFSAHEALQMGFIDKII
jgi:ATP-dependent protease ClpP protease subunit